MRDLLYLSESKMKDLVPQLPRKVLKRLGMEAGVNVGVLSLRATLSPSEQTSQVALLDSVINMIEGDRLTRWRSDPDLRAGDWVQFEEEFLYGAIPPETEQPLPPGELVYFNAIESQESMFSLCGSPSHLKGGHYNLPTKQRPVTAGEIASILGSDNQKRADLTFAPRKKAQDGRRIEMAGHARVLAVFDDFILGTPLYVEYASTGR